MAVEKVELMHECCPKHKRMKAARIKWGEQTEEEGKLTRVNSLLK